MTVTQSPPTQTVIFEHPLNEYMRICLRLEQLLRQLHEYLDNPSMRGSQHALVTLLRLIEVIDRPDLKSKLMQSLTQYATSLGQLDAFPQVDKKRLQAILGHLDKLISELHNMQGRICETLRLNDFLTQLRPQLTNPGGIFLHHVPALTLWLNQPAELRCQELTQWADQLHPLPEITQLSLDLTRYSADAITVQTSHGFYHQPLDPTLPWQMIRIEADLGIYPEISAGKYRFSVRFVKPNFITGERAKQVSEPIRFALTCCRF